MQTPTSLADHPAGQCGHMCGHICGHIGVHGPVWSVGPVAISNDIVYVNCDLKVAIRIPPLGGVDLVAALPRWGTDLLVNTYTVLYSTELYDTA